MMEDQKKGAADEQPERRFKASRTMTPGQIDVWVKDSEKLLTQLTAIQVKTAVDVYSAARKGRKRKVPVEALPVPHPSRAVVNWLPLPRTRKSLRKMLADQEAEIAALHARGDYRAARWQAACTWGLLIVSLAWRPVVALVRLAKRFS